MNYTKRFASLRYFNPIGAHPSGLIGEFPKGKPNNVSFITNTAIGLQKEFTINGNNWPTEDGTPIRDYIHVMDLADAHAQIFEHLLQKESLCVSLNIGTVKGTSVLNL